MRAEGNPGGVFHLRDGLVVAVDSPGAPGVEALLLRSGRISESDWTAALRDGAQNRSRQAELAARGALGATELRVVAMTVVRDSAFAVAVGEVDGHAVDAAEPGGEVADVLLPLADGVEPDELVRETVRRLAALTSLPWPVSPYRDRFVPARDGELTAVRREIVAHANGRRSARDIAFAVGRGVYPVTVEISRMLGDGLLAIAGEAPEIRPATRLEALRPRRDAGGSQAGGPMTSRPFRRRRTERKHIGL